MKSITNLVFIIIVTIGSGHVLAQGRIDREYFFKSCESVIAKKDIFYHKTKTGTEKHWLKADPVINNPGKKTIEGIFDLSESHWNKIDNRKIAYILGTAYRESWFTMTPIREGKCGSDKCAIDAIDRLIEKKPEKYKTNYALPLKENGKSYYGRGLVQITKPENYRRIGKALGMGDQLYDNPDLALNLNTAIKIIVVGMDKGVFTHGTHTLDRYFNETKTDWLNARRIVNGGSMDNARITAAYAQKFFECLEKQ